MEMAKKRTAVRIVQSVERLHDWNLYQELTTDIHIMYETSHGRTRLFPIGADSKAARKLNLTKGA